MLTKPLPEDIAHKSKSHVGSSPYYNPHMSDKLPCLKMYHIKVSINPMEEAHPAITQHARQVPLPKDVAHKSEY